MARYEFEGINEAIARTQTDIDGLRSRIGSGLVKGANILKEALERESESFAEYTGELAGKVKPDNAPTITTSGGSIEVYARGAGYKGPRGGKPRRSETVAFVVEYGRGGGQAFSRASRRGAKMSKTGPNPWDKRAVEASSEAVGAAISEEIFNVAK